MARLQAQEKLLFFPTPDVVTKSIATWFTAPEPFRAFDPAAGTGEAVELFCNQLNTDAEKWGIELSYVRAKQAEEHLDIVLPSSFYLVNMDKEAASIAFNNPPYDYSHRIDNKTGKRIRHERLFGIGATYAVVRGGHQVLIIPRHQLADPELVRSLCGWYDRIKVRRFPGEEFDIFKQIVVFAIGKKKRYANPKAKYMEAILSFGGDPDYTIVPELTDGDGRIVIPPTPVGKFKFTFKPTSPEALVRLGHKASPIGTDEWYRETYVRPPGDPINPAVPEKIGHISMEISSGEVGNVSFQKMVAKGTIKKVMTVYSDPQENEEGKYTHSKMEGRETLQTNIAIFHENGNAELLSERDEVAEFITKHAKHIGDVLLKRNVPTYKWDPTEYEWDTVSKVALGLPALPGRSERGLFKIQKHMSIAAYRTMLKYRQAILNAEMGFGKTATSVGVAELLNEWPILIVCPGHMVYKWQREIEESGDPDDPIVGRVINRPVRGGGLWFNEEVKPVVEKSGCKVTSKHRYQTRPIGKNDSGARVTFNVECITQNATKDLLANIKRRFAVSAGKNNAGKNVRILPEFSLTDCGLEVTIYDRDEYTVADFVSDFKSGKLGNKAAAIIGIEGAKYSSGINKDRPGYKTVQRKVWDNDSHSYYIRDMVQCPTCGGLHDPNDKIPEYCNLEYEKPIFDEEKVEVDKKLTTCGGAMIEMSRWRREGLSQILQKKYKHFFRLYIADEIHKAKGGKTDVGAADSRLIEACKYGLALTGTLFGGNSSSIFYLLFRRNREVRKLYSYTDKTRWIDHFGLWEHRWSEKEPKYTGRSWVTGKKRWGMRSKELPGVSPAVIRYMLPIVLFGKITDLGYELPPLYEEVDTSAMTSIQSDQYKQFDKQFLSEAMHIAQADGDPGALSKWFSTNRYRPMSGFRDEVAAYESKKSGATIVMNLPQVVSSASPWLPKEQRLAEIIKENMLKGRKSLVFVEQSGTRDIRNRLMEVLNTLVPTAVVAKLSASSMTPAKREAWINTNAPGMDVLIVNPKLVETGLDLVMFNDIIFYELPLSLYTLWQAMRRVWRLGQSKDVMCRFMVYSETIEQALLQRMGTKLKSAMLLYGDEAAGAIIESDEGDLQREIIQNALKGVSYQNLEELNKKDVGLVQGLFSTGTEKVTVVTDSPMGSPIAQSAPMPVLAFEIEFEGPAQLSMFGSPVPAKNVKSRRRR